MSLRSGRVVAWAQNHRLPDWDCGTRGTRGIARSSSTRLPRLWLRIALLEGQQSPAQGSRVHRPPAGVFLLSRPLRGLAASAAPADAVMPPRRVVAGSMSLRSGGRGIALPVGHCGMAWDKRNRAPIEHATSLSPALHGPSGEAAVTASGLPGALAFSRPPPRPLPSGSARGAFGASAGGGISWPRVRARGSSSTPGLSPRGGQHVSQGHWPAAMPNSWPRCIPAISAICRRRQPRPPGLMPRGAYVVHLRGPEHKYAGRAAGSGEPPRQRTRSGGSVGACLRRSGTAYNADRGAGAETDLPAKGKVRCTWVPSPLADCRSTVPPWTATTRST